MYRNYKLLFLFLLILVTGFKSLAASSAQIVVNPYVVQGQNFTLTYRLINCDDQITQAPQLKGCQLLYGPGLSSYESVEYINGKVSRIYVGEYSFTYCATAPGRVAVPRRSVHAAGKTINISAKTFEILPPDKSQPTRQNSQPNYSTAMPDPEPGDYREKVRPNDLIVTVTMSKSNIYEKEAVIATIKVYTKHEITSFKATTLPSFDGFLSEELDVSNQQPKIEHYNGENYYSAVLKQCVLYPQKSGRLTINSGRYDVKLRLYERIAYGYMYTNRPFDQNVTTTSRSISVDVKNLPKPAPIGFNGAVGNFKVSSSLEPQVLRTNEAANYVVRISGTGNLKYLTSPTIDFPKGLEVYNTEVDADAKFNGAEMAGTFSASYPLMPQNVGDVVIPGWNFVYFDPVGGRYKTISMPSYQCTVKQGASVSDTQSEVAEVTDIKHIKDMSKVTLKRNHNEVFGSTLYVIYYFIVILILITTTIVYRRYIKLNSDLVARRTARAARVANKRLHIARQAMNNHDNEKFYELLAKAMWGYISDKLRIPSSALTRDNINEKMLHYGADEKQVMETIDILDQCEMARFAPGHSDDQVATLYNDAVNTISSIEAVKKLPTK